MKKYNHKRIENKWQKEWEKKKLYQAKNNSKRKKFYVLIEFPYPSGSGLHVGHIRSNTAMDIISRKRRMEGYNVLYPIGWDAFGLPTENYAIKTGIHPKKVTKKNTDIFRKQLKMIGFSFDWSREINTTDPNYYKWTQWIFLQFFKKGLAYKSRTEINWCSKDKIGLANEEVIAGCCERCGSKVIKKQKKQWMLAITKYADRLDKDLDDVDFLERIKIQQRNWIGKSEGAEIDFSIYKSEHSVKIFTTRADTIFSATYIVLAPEHELISLLKDKISNLEEVNKYITSIKEKDEISRTDNTKEKTGIQLKGLRAINPANGEEIPIWIAGYVLPHYGTGAIMAVPVHDQRDFDFAKNYNIRVVDKPLVDAKKVVKKVKGKMVTKYKLRDWVFSRQRYWGEPIPIIYCNDCGYVPVPEKDLPVELPKVKSYMPTDTGESPLDAIQKWVNTTCPVCKGPAKRETDTMPNWAGSSWYYLRYVDPKNKKEFASKKSLDYWLGVSNENVKNTNQPKDNTTYYRGGVDWYNGGMEHTTLHLLYSRFWHKFLYDLNLVPNKEPYAKRTSHGLILADKGEKMSKSKGNVVNPDDIVKMYGADTLRIYEMFMGPFDQAVTWNTDSIIGSRRFLEKVWKIGQEKLTKRTEKETRNLLHKTIKKVSEDIEIMHFNTAISSMMVLVNQMDKTGISIKDFEKFLKILAPFAPHITEELWKMFKEKKSIHISNWPNWNWNFLQEEELKISIQINGKFRTNIFISKETNEEEIKKIVLSNDVVVKFMGKNNPKRIIYVKNKLINIVF